MPSIILQAFGKAFQKVFGWLTNILYHKRSLYINPSQQNEIKTRTLNILTLIKEHRYEEALDSGSFALKFLLSPPALEKIFVDLHTQHGEIVSFSPIDVEGSSNLGNGISKTANILVKFQRGELLAVVTFDYLGNLSGLRLKPKEEGVLLQCGAS